MKNGIIEFLKHLFSGRNLFASHGLLLMAIGDVGAYLRSIPRKLLYGSVGQTTMMITVKDDDAAFLWVKEWFLDQEFRERVRRIDLDTTLQSEAGGDDSHPWLRSVLRIEHRNAPWSTSSLASSVIADARPQDLLPV